MVSILQGFSRIGRFIRGDRFWRRDDSHSDVLKIRCCAFEKMEPRQLLSGAPPQIHFGSVFFDASPGTNTSPDTIQITFQGGAPNTQLTQLVIDGSKNQLGLAVGDDVWEAPPGSPSGTSPVTVVSHTGFQVLSVTATNGGSQIVITFSGFVPGDMLVLSATAEEVTAIDPVSGAPTLAPLTKGNDFQSSHLVGTFTAPHFENVTVNTAYVAGYDLLFAQNDDTSGSQLGLPTQDYEPPSTTDQSDQTTGASVLVTQTPLPISVAGTVYSDPNLNNVQDSGEPGIAGVSLTLLEYNGSSYVSTGKTTTTDANGNYIFKFLLPGTYEVVETVPTGYFAVGASAGTVNGSTDAVVLNSTVIDQIAVLGGDNSINNDFALAQAIGLSGYVYHDTNDNGIRESGENGIGGVTIVVTPISTVDGSTASVSIVTDSNGFWSVSGLAPGTYTVYEPQQPPGYLDGITTPGSLGGTFEPIDQIVNITTLGGQSGTEYDFGKLLPASLSGGIADCLAGVPLSGVTVQLLDANGNVLKTTTTDEDGDYEFTGLTPGQVYGVNEILPAGYIHNDETVGSAGGIIVNDTFTQIQLGDGVNATGYDFCDILPASLSGSVADCLAGVPLSGVTVQLLDANGDVLKTTTTDDQGNYTFTNLKPGQTYGVDEILPPGYVHNDETVGSVGGIIVNDTITQIPLGDGVNGVNYDFCDIRPASLSGSVADCLAGVPLSGVTVQLLNADGNVIKTTTTDDQGNYSFTNLTPGQTYGVDEILPPGYVHNDETVGSAGGVIVNDAIVDVPLGDGVNGINYDFCDIRPASLSGNVADCLAGVPLSGVTVQLLDTQGNVLESTTTNAQGNYEFTNLTPGKVYAVAEILPAGYIHNDETVGSAGGSIVNYALVDIPLGDGVSAVNYDFCDIRPGSISGSVDDCIAGVPLSDVTVRLLDANGNVIETTTTDEEGDYSFTNLKPGQVYGVDEILPAGYYHNDETVGSAGGSIVNDAIVQISLGDGVNATNYDFCDVLPGSISGKVWEDTNGNCSFQPGVDIPLAGVQLDLINSQGKVVATTLTDSQGDYTFSNLLPDTYSVQEHVPAGYSADMDTVGTINGITVGGHPNNTLLNSISLNYENNGINYDFCVTKKIPPPPPPPQQPPTQPPPPAAVAPSPLIPLVIPPYQPQFENPDLNAGDAVGYTWHLSIVDAGFPRGSQGQSVAMDLSNISVETASWMDANMVSGVLTYLDANGQPVERQVMGFKDGIPVVGDFRGDGQSELGFYVDGQWFIDLNGDGRWDAGDIWAKLGTRADQPVIGDWNGDGKDDIGLYGPAWPRDPHAVKVDRGLPSPLNKTQIVSKRKKNVPPDQDDATSGGRDLQRGQNGKTRTDVIDHVFHYGSAVEKAVVGDWMGTGLRHVGVFRNGKWYLDTDGDGRLTEKDLECVFGQEGDIPVVGDWTGDGIEKIGVYRNGTFYLDTNNNHKLDADDQVIQLGQPGDIPVVGKFDGTGRVSVGVYHTGGSAAVQTAVTAPATVKK